MEKLMALHTQFRTELGKAYTEYANASLETAQRLMKETGTVKLVDAIEVIAKRRAIKALEGK